MVEDKIKLLLKRINDLRQDLKDVKSDLKQEEKIDDEQYLQMKKAYKEMREQIKDFENEERAGLADDDHYNKLREMKIEKEEEIANAREELFKNISKLPSKAFEMSVDTEEGNVRMQVVPDMRVFLNGKEEKKAM